MKSLVVFFGVFCVFEFTYADSYVEAYKNLQNEKLDEAVSKKDIDREFQTNDYAPPYPYGPPAQAPQYGAPYPPAPNYGPPNPAPNYGPPNPAPPPPPPPPPQPMYGPPPVYGPPSSVQVFYGAPHALGSIWEKIKWKLDLFTIGKLLLKLVLFKKFVSWVALLCLLFIIPTLKNKFESFGSGGGGGGLGGIGGERSFKRTDNEDLDQLFNNISKALEKFSFRDKSIDDGMSKISR